MPIPITCTLNAEDARCQADEWHGLLDRASSGAERVSATELAVHLVDDPELVADVLALARREKACCPFFDFTLCIGAEALTFHIGVPEDAAYLLDDLVPWTTAGSTDDRLTCGRYVRGD